MLEQCEELGMFVNPQKVEGPSTELEYLGIIIDSQKMELRMSDSRIADVKC